MTWIWIFLGSLVALAGLRYRQRLGSTRPSGSPRVDDDALRRILEEGRLSADDVDDEPLDLEEAARAEEEFWDDWEDPEEYRP